jgi:hypothetical protein
MTTLEELIYYCNEPEPVGALMLTGEWGCGKTYLLEHSLKDKLIDTHTILRISLFGLSSIEAINDCARSTWLNAYLEDKGWDEKSKTVSKLQSKLARLPLPEDWKNIVTFNPAALLNVTNEMNDKKVILIFDDLERCKLNTIDVLGCINDYCENQKFHTIVVANEDKIHNKQQEALANMESKEVSVDEKSKIAITLNYPQQQKATEEISYEEIKEKIIQRTIKYKPDYASIVHTIIVNQVCLSEEYHEFLKQHEDDILNLFAPAIDKDTTDDEDIFSEPKEKPKRPHNIRSLKCSLQDFYRIFVVLVNNEFSDLDKWLSSFVSYMLSYKAGIAKEGKYGTIFADKEVGDLYPAFNNSRFMLETAKNWIFRGEWDEELLKKEIKVIKDRQKAATPKDVVRTYRIMDVEEDILIQGFHEVLEMAYGGLLSLDEYVNFIMNCYWARKYQFELPCIIDWDRIKQGILLCIRQMTEQCVKDVHVRSIISHDDKELFKQAEWEAYELIETFWNGNVLMFNENKRLYLDSIKRDVLSAFFKCENKRMDVFDGEMAEATANAFSQCNNSEKHIFSVDFKNMWKNYRYWPDIKLSLTNQGFKELLVSLKEEKESLLKQNKMIAVGHTDEFIKVVEKLAQDIASEC